MSVFKKRPVLQKKQQKKQSIEYKVFQVTYILQRYDFRAIIKKKCELLK